MILLGRWAWWNGHGSLDVEGCVGRALLDDLEGVIIKYGRPDIEREFEIAHLPWGTERYAYPTQAEAEGTKLANAVDAGAAFAVVNAEVEWEGEGYEGPLEAGRLMERLLMTFRQRHPDVELYGSVDTRAYRTSLPYQQVLREYVTAILPMIYPLAFRPHRPEGFVAAAFRDCLDNKDFGGLPVLPTLQCYGGIGLEAVAQQVVEVGRRGLLGSQAYTIQHATDDEWAAFTQTDAGEEDFACALARLNSQKWDECGRALLENDGPTLTKWGKFLTRNGKLLTPS